jgi:hypothetical protein
MLTEFGNEASGGPEVSFVMDLSDSYLQSWIIWGGMDQLPSQGLKDDLIRTYAQAVAGTPISMNYNTYGSISMNYNTYELISMN